MKFFDYISGKRKGKEAHNIELDAMSDPFLSDAIDGYDETAKTNHVTAIKRMQKKVKEKTKKTKNIPIWSAIAGAAIVIVAFVTGFLYLADLNKNLTALTYAKTNPLSELSHLEKETPHPKNVKAQHQSSNTPSQRSTNKTKNDEDISKNLSRKQKVTYSTSNNQQAITSLYAQNTHTSSLPKGKKRVKTMLLNNNTSEKEEENSDIEIVLSKASRYYIDSELLSEDESGDDKRQSSNEIANFSGISPHIITERKRMENSIYSEPISGLLNYKQYLEKGIKEFSKNTSLHPRGKLKISFITNSDGYPTDIQIEKSLNNQLEEEVVRLLETGSTWGPSSSRTLLEINIK